MSLNIINTGREDAFRQVVDTTLHLQETGLLKIVGYADVLNLVPNGENFIYKIDDKRIHYDRRGPLSSYDYFIEIFAQLTAAEDAKQIIDQNYSEVDNWCRTIQDGRPAGGFCTEMPWIVSYQRAVAQAGSSFARDLRASSELGGYVQKTFCQELVARASVHFAHRFSVDDGYFNVGNTPILNGSKGVEKLAEYYENSL
jgi:hypothetical protein